jgi:hypothetical protein
MNEANETYRAASAIAAFDAIQVPETAHPPTTHCSKIIPDFMSARGANIVVCCGVSWFLIIVAEQEIPSRPAR